MRVFRKIMFIILSFVPILPLLLFAVCNLGNTSGVDMIPFGGIRVANAGAVGIGGFREETKCAIISDGTILEYFLSGFISESEYIEVADIEVMDGDVIQEELDISEGKYIVIGVNGQVPVNDVRFIDRVFDLYDWFSTVGMTPPSYMVYVFAYLAYMLFIHVAFMIFDIIVFIPKKISEMLEG